jgi:hypothetical protein
LGRFTDGFTGGITNGITDGINSVGDSVGKFVGKNDTSSFFFLLCFNFFSHGNSLGIYVCIYQFSGSDSRAGFCLNPDRSQARVGRVLGRPAGPVRVLKLYPIE